MGNPVCVEICVSADENKLFDDNLGDEQRIERITVVPWSNSAQVPAEPYCAQKLSHEDSP